MSTTTHTAENVAGNETSRQIDPERYHRACTEEMDLETIAPGMMSVEHNAEEYRVDLESGSCDCADAQYRPELFCKHAIKAALVSLFKDDQRNSRFVARVAHYATEHDCPADVRRCDGPTTIGERGFPCPDCCVADEWDIWTTLCDE